MVQETRLIELKGVCKSFGDTQVLHDVDLYIRKCEFITLLGPSGCGKTTLLRIIGGFDMPSSGQVLFEGSDLPAFFSKADEKLVFGAEDIFVKEYPEGYRGRIKWLIPSAQKNQMEPILVEMAPGGETAEDDPHEGEEFGYVLAGTVKIVLGDRTEKARKDESFCFRPTAPHKLVNAGKGVCKVLWVSTPPSV